MSKVHVVDYCAFVVDTDSYAGNFEREIVAYMTGHVGDCGVGDSYATEARKELPPSVRAWLDDHVIQRTDERTQCHRPAVLMPTPGWFDTGVGCALRDDTPADDVLAAHKKAVDAYYQHAGAPPPTSYTAPERYPAYLSAGVWLDEPPPPHVIDVLKQRARTFTSGDPRTTPRTISGFRVVQWERVEHQV